MAVLGFPEKEIADHVEGDEETDLENVPGTDRRELSSLAATELASYNRKMLVKLDVVLVPTMAMLYLLAFLDRANIGNARVAGLQEDLRMSSHQYSTAVTATYVLYIAAELPSNLILRKIGPRLLLSGLCFCWGVVTTLQSQVNSYSGLLAARLILGMAEGGLFPGINLYLSMFYRRDELQLRIALFYSAAALSGAFGGLLAAAIEKMDGIGGLAGWQWIFCLEGLFTVCFSVVAFFVLPNHPSEVRTFIAEEAKRYADRLRLDAEFPNTERVTLKGVLSVFTTPHILILFPIMFASACCLFSMAYFTPTIVAGMGYSSTRTQLMTVPPFAVGFVVCVTTSYLSDRHRKRGLAAIVTGMVALVGVIMFYRGRSNAVRYASLFLVISGLYANGPCYLSWIPNNTAAHTRRATAIATCFVFTNSGGILSAWIFPSEQAPYYPLASKLILSMTVVTLVFTVAEMWMLAWLNKRKETPEYREKLLGQVQGMDLAEQFVKLGDAHPDYKYFL
ncbi:hypothetical protein CLAIMM_04473 [Cladophialophora immunda]|nr:hypothetical protein CLAIMM_04473 [Cladophialophora immunda]